MSNSSNLRPEGRIEQRIAQEGANPQWKSYRLDKVAQIIMGQSPPSEFYNTAGDGLPFFQGKAEFGDLYPTPVKWCSNPTKLAKRDDVLISVRAPVGPTNLASSDCCIGRGLAALRPLEDMPSKYLLYYLRSIEAHLDSLGTGSTFKAISGSTLRSLEVPVPSPEKQNEIVAEIETQFSRLDEAVASLKRAQANLKRYKTAVLKAAVEGKLTEQWRKDHRDVEPASELLKRILAERRQKWNGRGKYKEPAALDISDLPSLPRGWVWATVDQVGSLQLGRQRAPRYHNGSDMRPYLRVQNVFEDKIDLSDVMEMDFPPTDFKKYRLDPGDLLLNEGQSPELLGRPAIYRGELPNACFTNTLIRFRPIGSVLVEYALILFRHYMHSRRFISEGAITTNIAHLSVGRFAQVEFVLPPLEEQGQIVSGVDRMLSLAAGLERALAINIQRASTLRAAVLSESFYSTR